MAVNVRIINDGPAPWPGFLALAPAVIPPWWMSIQAWHAMSAQNAHPLLKAIAVAAIFVAFFYALDFVFKRIPVLLAALGTGVGIAIGWGAIALTFGLDQVWAAAIAAIAAVIGFFVGRTLASAPHLPGQNP